ncbi:MAG: hypothetical protein AB1414_02910 [bacterium]
MRNLILLTVIMIITTKANLFCQAEEINPGDNNIRMEKEEGCYQEMKVGTHTVITNTNSVSYEKENKFSKGKRLLEKGRWKYDEDILENAILIFQYMIKEEDSNYLYYYYLAYAYERLILINDIEDKKDKSEDYAKKALHIIERSIQLNDNFPESHYILARIQIRLAKVSWLMGARYGPKIGKERDRVLELNSNSPQASLLLALTYLETPRFFGGNVNKAIEKLEEIIKLNPMFDEAYIHLSQAYKRKRWYDKEKEILEKALKINPYNLYARKILKKVVINN